MSYEVVMEATRLRGEGKFAEAIKFVEENESKLDEVSRLMAYIQAFHAAKNTDDEAQAIHWASKIKEEDPNVPLLKNYL